MVHVYIYSDESGVFDQINNDTFVYGGIIFTDLQEKTLAERRYIAVEKRLRKKEKYKKLPELKASKLENKDKRNLFDSMNRGYRFAIVIKQKRLSSKVFKSPESKERYLDYAFKIGLKDSIVQLLKIGEISRDDEVFFHIDVDEHSTATNGRYSLEEGILKEFRDGTQNWDYGFFIPPILPNTYRVEVHYRQSERATLVRAADIIANRVYSSYREETPFHEELSSLFLTIKLLP